MSRQIEPETTAALLSNQWSCSTLRTGARLVASMAPKQEDLDISDLQTQIEAICMSNVGLLHYDKHLQTYHKLSANILNKLYIEACILYDIYIYI